MNGAVGLRDILAALTPLIVAVVPVLVVWLKTRARFAASDKITSDTAAITQAKIAQAAAASALGAADRTAIAQATHTAVNSNYDELTKRVETANATILALNATIAELRSIIISARTSASPPGSK